MAAGFFGKLWNGIKKGAKKAAEIGKKVVNKVVEYAPKVIDGAKKVAGFVANNKDTIAGVADMIKPGYGRQVSSALDKGLSYANTGINYANQAHAVLSKLQPMFK